MALSRLPAAMQQTMRLLGAEQAADLAIRQAAWVARCVGRGEAAPLSQDDVAALGLSSVAQRLAVSQNRIIGLLGRSLTERVARLLLDESVDDATGNMVNWYLTSSAGTPLADGRVLVTGGERDECDPTGEMCDIIPTTAAEIFTP